MGSFNTVRAEAACPHCGRTYPVVVQFLVYIEGDTVVRVVPSDGRYDFATASDGYLVLEE